MCRGGSGRFQGRRSVPVPGRAAGSRTVRPYDFVPVRTKGRLAVSGFRVVGRSVSGAILRSFVLGPLPAPCRPPCLLVEARRPVDAARSPWRRQHADL